MSPLAVGQYAGAVQPARSVPARFWSKVDTSAGMFGCWLWQDRPDPDGYGRLIVGGKHGQQVRAHRLSWELVNGPVPAGMTLDHLCETKLCVNPAHLEPVTGAENTRRYFRNRVRSESPIDRRVVVGPPASRSRSSIDQAPGATGRRGSADEVPGAVRAG